MIDKIFNEARSSLLSKSLTLIAYCIFLGACSTNRDLVDTPNIIIKNKGFPHSNNHTIRPNIIYTTDRKPRTEKSILSYSSERSSSMAYGLAEVSFEGAKNWSELERASSLEKRNPKISLSLSKINELSRFPETPVPFEIISGQIKEKPEERKKYSANKSSFQKLLRDQLKKSEIKEVIIYIHGFNVDFNGAVFDLADIWHFTGRHGVPLLYSWPAGNGGLFGYFTDRESGEFTIYHLKEFLRIIRDTKEIKKIHIIAHSRGTDIMTSALRELIIESKGSEKKSFKNFPIASLTLAAPDLDFDVVRQRLIAEKFAQAFKQINIYTNSTDGALGVAQKIMSSTRFGKLKLANLGESETAIFKSLRHVNFINVSGVKGFFGHSYYREHPGALSDIIQVIKTNALPGETERPLIHKQGNFWGLKTNYLLKK